MRVLGFPASDSRISNRQRWSFAFAFLFSLGAFFIGINLRDGALNATWTYSNPAVGIRADYPQNWLIDTTGNYIFRVRNISQIGYPTTIQVAVQPVSQDTTARYIFDALTLNRSQTLASYNTLSSGATLTLPDETTGTIMNYTYAATENDPLLESVPLVVQGQDILTIKRGQAIIITYLSASTNFERDYAIFERFLSSLEF
jgi:hypothetical protein